MKIKMNSIPPRVLAVHDLSGFGRGSLTTVISVLANMKIQACPMPTSLLSTHSEFTNFSFLDLTSEMRKFISHWKNLGLKFDAIYSGFLGSSVQTKLVEECIKTFSHEDTIILIDPVLGDNGDLYPTMDKNMILQMRNLIKFANIITPNLTEAALLLDEPVPTSLDKSTLISWLHRLSDMGPHTVIITSAIINEEKDKMASAVLAYQRPDNNDEKGHCWQVSCEYIPAFYPGTGDIFASIVTGSILWKEELPVAIARAMRFIANGIKQSILHNEPCCNGILLELILDSLQGPLSYTNCQELIEKDYI